MAIQSSRRQSTPKSWKLYISNKFHLTTTLCDSKKGYQFHLPALVSIPPSQIYVLLQVLLLVCWVTIWVTFWWSRCDDPSTINHLSRRFSGWPPHKTHGAMSRIHNLPVSGYPKRASFSAQLGLAQLDLRAFGIAPLSHCPGAVKHNPWNLLLRKSEPALAIQSFLAMSVTWPKKIVWTSLNERP